MARILIDSTEVHPVVAHKTGENNDIVITCIEETTTFIHIQWLKTVNTWFTPDFCFSSIESLALLGLTPRWAVLATALRFPLLNPGEAETVDSFASHWKRWIMTIEQMHLQLRGGINHCYGRKKTLKTEVPQPCLMQIMRPIECDMGFPLYFSGARGTIRCETFERAGENRAEPQSTHSPIFNTFSIDWHVCCSSNLMSNNSCSWFVSGQPVLHRFAGHGRWPRHPDGTFRRPRRPRPLQQQRQMRRDRHRPSARSCWKGEHVQGST